jgi:tetratricopeptide (TPR) repeat protein
MHTHRSQPGLIVVQKFVAGCVRLTALLVLAVGFVLPALADVIVLKSGRRIQAASVVERDGKVHYETDLGSFAIPARLVERIERGDVVFSPKSARKADLPAVSGGVERGLQSFSDAGVEDAVKDGSVNFAFLSELDREARSTRSAQAGARAATAHVRVAKHYLEKREWRFAEQSLLQALNFVPNHPVLLLRLASLELEMQKYDLALSRLAPVLRDMQWAPDGYRLLGIVYYRREEMPRAVEAWKQSLKLRPDPQLEKQLASLEREAEAAEDFRGEQSRRFILRYDQEIGTHNDFGRDVLSALENMYDDVARTFHTFPREQIVVLLYPTESFYELTGAPSNVHGIFDGKIRVPAKGLTSLPPRLQTTLRHELVHAFVYLKTRGRAPRWLQEGLAQWHAGQSSRAPRSAFRPLFEQRDGTALQRIQAGFQGSSDQVMTSYAAAWLVVDVLEQRYGAAGRDRLLQSLGRGNSMTAALKSAFRIDLVGLDGIMLDAL